MIVSHRHRFVFLKTAKTAGTSVEVFLRRFCGPDDIITPITPIDEQVPLAAGHPPRNYDEDRALEQTYCEHVTAGRLEEALAMHERGLNFYNHMSAAELSQCLGAALLEDYFVFTMERHPYDKAISRAAFELGLERYRAGKTRQPEPDVVIRQIRRRLAAGGGAIFSSWGTYTIDDRVIADAVIYYENMQEGLHMVLNHLGLAGQADIGEALPHFKGGIRPRSMTRAMLPEDCKAVIREICIREFKAFGYLS